MEKYIILILELEQEKINNYESNGTIRKKQDVQDVQKGNEDGSH